MISDHFRNRLLHALWPEFDLIEPDLRIVDIAPGTVLLEPDEPFEHVWFPLSGTLSVVCSLPNGAQVQACAVGWEGALGLVEALNARPSGVTVTCPAGARLSGCTAEAFRQVHAESERLRALTLQHAGDLVRALITEAACHAMHGVEVRLCRWLLDCDERGDSADLRLTQETLALLLGVQRTTVSAVMSGLQAAGLASTTRGTIRLLNRAGLRRRACGCDLSARTETLNRAIGPQRLRSLAPRRSWAAPRPTGTLLRHLTVEWREASAQLAPNQSISAYERGHPVCRLPNT